MVTEIEERELAYEVHRDTIDVLDVYKNTLSNEKIKSLKGRLEILAKSHDYVATHFKLFMNSNIISEATYIIYVSIMLHLDKKKTIELLDEISKEYPVFGFINKQILFMIISS